MRKRFFEREIKIPMETFIVGGVGLIIAAFYIDSRNRQAWLEAADLGFRMGATAVQVKNARAELAQSDGGGGQLA